MRFTIEMKSVEPREFFIEDRLEKYRMEAPCNLGESGIRNISLGELLASLGMNADVLSSISLADAPNHGSHELRKEIAALYPNITPEQVLVTTGTSEALYLFFLLTVEKGSKLNVFWPAFQALYEIPQMLGAIINPISVLHGMDIDLLFGGQSDILVINHPHNPTGRKITSEMANRLKRLVLSYEGYILFDEHYRFLDYEDDLTFTGSGLTAKTFATGSITKCFGVTGLRIGWLVGGKEFIQRARSFKDYLTHTVNPLSEYLALQILQHRKKLVIPIKHRIQNNLQYFQDRLVGIKSIVNFNPPESGLVAFPELQPGMNSAEYCDQLYQSCGVFALPGSAFESEGFIRISFGEDENRFQSGIDRWILWENEH